MNLSSKKASLRSALFQKRRGLSRALRRRKSREILRKLLRDPHYRKAKKIAVYFDIPPEVETRFLLRKIVGLKEIFLPRTDTKKRDLVLHRVKDLARDLRRGKYSVLEPRPRCPRMAASAMELIIVPGVGFDKKGNRLGRGAGYYDRLLKRAKRVRKIGICFREQLVKKIPAAKRDIPVDRVITD